MSMTTELIDRLRQHADLLKEMGFDPDGMVMNDYKEAADTIQLLSEKLHASQMERSSQYYNDGWIPVSERLPEDLEPVNITWVNHKPEPYYHDIKDKPFTATGIHYKNQWYWYSTTCAYYLGEYGRNEFDLIDDAIEIVAWQPLPQPHMEEREDLK